MKRFVGSVIFLLVISSVFGQDSEIIAKNAKVEKAGSGFSFTEGPAVAPDGRRSAARPGSGRQRVPACGASVLGQLRITDRRYCEVAKSVYAPRW